MYKRQGGVRSAGGFGYKMKPKSLHFPMVLGHIYYFFRGRGRCLMLVGIVAMGSGSLVCPAGGEFYGQDKFGWLRSGWDEVRVGPGCQAGAGCTEEPFCMKKN